MSTTEISMLRYIKETPDQVRANIGDSKNLTRRMVEPLPNPPIQDHMAGCLRFKLQRLPLRPLLHEEPAWRRSKNRYAIHI